MLYKLLKKMPCQNCIHTSFEHEIGLLIKLVLNLHKTACQHQRFVGQMGPEFVSNLIMRRVLLGLIHKKIHFCELEK